MTKEEYIKLTRPRVENPVNPAEDFADGWSKPDIGRKLEESFFQWHEAACRDFKELGSIETAERLKERVEGRLAVPLSLEEARSFVHGTAPKVIVSAPFVNVDRDPPRPWSE